jgi:hypothetical protein
MTPGIEFVQSVLKAHYFQPVARAIGGSELNSFIAAKRNAVGVFKPRFANSMIFSATNWVVASSRLLNPSASTS